MLTEPVASEDEESRRQELVDLYKVAVEEYRFQVDLNWKRTQYFLALNVAILGVGTGLVVTIQVSVARGRVVGSAARRW